MSFIRNAFIFAKHDHPDAELSVSVQASAGHYCSPRTDDAPEYTAVEVMLSSGLMPSVVSPELRKYDECFDSMGIAGWMPAERAKALLMDVARIWGPCSNPDKAGKVEWGDSAPEVVSLKLLEGQS